MESLLRNVWSSLWAGDAGRDRRRAVARPAFQCEALEERQLLSWGAGGVAGFAGYGPVRGGPAAFGHHAMPYQPGGAHHFLRGGHHGVSGQFLPNGSATSPPSSPTGQTSSDPTSPPASTSSTPSNQTATPSAPAGGDTSTPQSGTPAAQTAAGTGTQTPGSPAPQGSLTPNTQPPASPNPQVTADFQKLQSDQLAIQEKSQVTLGQLATLRSDFLAIDKAATSAPSQTTVQALQNDVKALQGNLPTDAQKTQLEADFTALVKSRGVTDQPLIDNPISDVEGIVTASNVTADDLARIAADRKQIQTDLAASNPNGSQNGPAGGNGGPVGGMDGLFGFGSLLGGAFGGPIGHDTFGGLQGGAEASHAPSRSGAAGGPFGGRMNGSMSWLGGQSYSTAQVFHGPRSGPGGPAGRGWF